MRCRSFRAPITVASAAIAVLALLPLLSPMGCRQLAPLPSNTCGNGVVDPAREDCDIFAGQAGTACRLPGVPGECRFDCTKDADGSGPSCPTGWKCGGDHICRFALGAFAPPRVIGRGATQIALADFDADGRQDLFLLDNLDSQGIGRASVRYFDDRFALSATTELGQFRIAPAVLSPSDGSLPSLGLIPAGSGLAFLRGRRDRAFDAAIQSSFSWPESVYGVTHRSDTGAPAVLLSDIPSGGAHHAWYGFDGVAFNRRVPGDVPPGSSTFAHAKLTAGASCESIAYLSEVGSIAVVPLCDAQGLWNTSIAPTVIPVAESVRQEGLVFADLNADGVLDLVFADGAGLEVAYATPATTGGASFSAPSRVPGLFDSGLGGVLLAAADLNADGVVDFAEENGLDMSRKSAGTIVYTRPVSVWSLDSWSSAIFADLDGDGALDLLASSATRYSLTFIKGGADPPLRATITTAGLADALTVGDFDGDLLNDVAYRQQDSQSSAIGVLFGHAGLPGPAVTTLAIAGLGRIDATSARVDLDGTSTPARIVALGTGPGTPASHISYVEESSVRQVLSPTLVPNSLSMFAATPRSADASTTSALALALITRNAHLRVSLQAIASDGAEAVRLADLGEFTGDPSTLRGLVAVGDVNMDGHEDAVALFSAMASPAGLGPNSSTLAVVSSDGGTPWRLAARGDYPMPVDSSSAMALEDLDGDSKLDLIVVGHAGPHLGVMSIHWNAGDGTFRTTPDFTLGALQGEFISGFALANISPRGPRAIVYAAGIGNQSSIVLLGFSPTRAPVTRHLEELANAVPSSIAAGDLDGDGVDDVVFADASGLVLLRGVPGLP